MVKIECDLHAAVSQQAQVFCGLGGIRQTVEVAPDNTQPMSVAKAAQRLVQLSRGSRLSRKCKVALRHIEFACGLQINQHLRQLPQDFKARLGTGQYPAQPLGKNGVLEAGLVPGSLLVTAGLQQLLPVARQILA